MVGENATNTATLDEDNYHSLLEEDQDPIAPIVSIPSNQQEQNDS